MRVGLAASVAAVTLLGAGAVQAQVVGHVGANYERMHVNSGVGNLDIGQIEGAAGFQTGMLGGQVDAAGTRYYSGGHITGYGGTVHLNLHGDMGLVGGFAGMYTAHKETFWATGLEAQANLGQAVLYAQAGYGQMDILPGKDFWAGRLEARYYVTDNFKLQASGGYMRGPQSGIGRFDFWNLGAEAEYQFEALPVSLVAGYEHGSLRHVGLDSDTIRVGVRYNFGGTLRERDQAGSSLNPSSQLMGGNLGQVLVTSFGELRDLADEFQ